MCIKKKKEEGSRVRCSCSGADKVGQVPEPCSALAFCHLFNVPSALSTCAPLPISATFSTWPDLQGPSPTLPFSRINECISFLRCQELHLFMAWNMMEPRKWVRVRAQAPWRNSPLSSPGKADHRSISRPSPSTQRSTGRCTAGHERDLEK